jgi:hypothetical protein
MNRNYLLVGALVIAGILAMRGVYAISPAGYNNVCVYRVNRLTGSVAFCCPEQPCKESPQ